MKIARPIMALFVCAFLLAGTNGLCAEPAPSRLILDAKDHHGLPANFRASFFPFNKQEANKTSRKGLGELYVSGSAQFSQSELGVMLGNLPAGLVVVDLRQESHAFINGAAVSWYGRRNWANQGFGPDRIRRIEQGQIKSLPVGAKVDVLHKISKNPDGEIADYKLRKIKVKRTATEEQLLRRAGRGYLRLYCRDHSRPSDENLERFIAFYRGLEPGTWLHFHCHAGKGRTTTFMLLTDMLKNASRLSLRELARRQVLIGGAELLEAGDKGQKWRKPLNAARADMLKRFYSYARKNPGGKPQTFREWLKAGN